MALTRRSPLIAPLVGALACAAAPVRAADSEAPERLAVHGQLTYTQQWASDFNSPYVGPNSLTPKDNAETVDLTLFVGAGLWSGAELWVSPEIDQGFGLDNTLGMAGFPSGEAYKVGKNEPYLRLQRLFVRQTLNRDDRREAVEPEQMQLGGERSPNRWVLTVGKFNVTDVFDGNQYAHDSKGDFMNWSAIDAGTYDYAADAWGYTVGAAIEWYQDAWALRFGAFDLSDVPNSPHLEPGFHEFQYDAEVERRFAVAGAPGALRITAFQTRGRMGLLNDAVALADTTAAPVDIAAVRAYRSRLGGSVGLEQRIGADLGVFARLGKAAGNVETYEFTDIDRSASAGLSLQGMRWRRAQDTVGVAGMLNNISADRRRYLDAGGLGILVGDGRLAHPGPEKIVETYYSAGVFHIAALTLDYQYVANPAYNRDRGPVSIYAVRLHAQF